MEEEKITIIKKPRKSSTSKNEAEVLIENNFYKNMSKSKILEVALGVLFGGILLFGAYTMYQDHTKLQSVIDFLNTQIQKTQQTQQTQQQPQQMMQLPQAVQLKQ
ncbi:MAG: hypothetical protein NTW62_03730 [Candidatus Nomurabacteria bacterium]|nr:hypothetical protein [Candidatus Nomurabacteria bacterium]